MSRLILKLLKAATVALLVFFVALFALIAHLQFTEEKADFNRGAAEKISFTPLEKIVPGGGIPSNLKIFRSNNNLDVVRYKDRFYFAFRSAPTHFASSETMLYVLSSADLKKWDFEAEFHLGSDLREPRLMVFRDKLFLYFFKGGANPLAFAPDYIYATKFIAKGRWKKPAPIYERGYVVWRAKEHAGRAYMSVYYGVGLYSNETMPTHLRLLESDDGYNWRIVNGREITTETSAEEGEFEFDEDGNLYATIRMEMKGGKVCFAPRADITAWKCRFTPFKIDSALMFRHGDEFYVVARRSLGGRFNRNSALLPPFLRSKWYLVRYSLTRKRTALYKVDKEKLALEPLFDFPSAGDTAYAGAARLEGGRYLLLNYSSDPDGFDWSWIGGQLAGSGIYSTTLEFGGK